MSIFIMQGRYTTQAMKGLITKPEDREAAVRRLVEAAGGKLLGFYITLGEYDWMSITEADDPVAVLSVLAIGASDGAVSDLKTTLAFTSAEAKDAYTRAGAHAAAFHPAGA